MVYLLFFLSGISGLIYQAVWVRVFGNVFGNTVHSAAIVIAVFMLGLGAGSYAGGAWADRRYAQRPESLLRAYGYVELAIGAGGLIVALLLPRLDVLATYFSSYTRAETGWYELSTASHFARAAIAIGLLTPVTLLMGGTLTLLVRHLVRHDIEAGDRRIALLYAINTAGAALGCFMTDIALVPAIGLLRTQIAAAACNAIAGVAALVLAYDHERRVATSTTKQTKSRKAVRDLRERESAFVVDHSARPLGRVVTWTAVALALTGFAAMGMEILWFRHVSILLGSFRAVFALLLTVILLGITIGSLVVSRLPQLRLRAGAALLVVQSVFVIATLGGLALASADAVTQALASARAAGQLSAIAEMWFDARPIVIEVAIPALLMGFSFPLANALIQQAEQSVGRRAGVIYLANTAGAVAGSLVAGFILLPWLGIQASAAVLMIAAVVALLPIARAAEINLAGAPGLLRERAPTYRRTYAPGIAVPAALAVVAWWLLPSDYILMRALGTPDAGASIVANSEGLTELVTVTETADGVRTLVTNGHPMSATTWLGQRYMRALAHVPLLAMHEPDAVLVIGFGVGNTTHAATLHPSVRRIEVADLSTNVLRHAPQFEAVNHGALGDARVSVFVNDGRHHLRTRPEHSYDLIALEPPPIAYAGVAALYSTGFYELARTRLKTSGYISQWLPAYQVPEQTTLAMVRSFVEVFPQSVLLSGAAGELLLIGTSGTSIAIDPEQLRSALERAPRVREDLRRLDLGTPREIVGAFVAAPSRLASATRDVAAVTDDRPVQEYGVASLLTDRNALPASLVDLRGVNEWCPTCFAEGRPVRSVDGLDVYLALLESAYASAGGEAGQGGLLGEARSPDAGGHVAGTSPSRPAGRTVLGSRYLGMLVPESAELHNAVGIGLAERGLIDEAIAEFRQALELEPASATTHWHLGAALASRGARAEAIVHLRRSLELDPGNAEAKHDLDAVLASS